MTETSRDAAYDRWHADKDRQDASWTPLGSPWYHSVSRSLPDLSSGDVLEVGCGRGEFALWLARERPGLRVTGLDRSRTAVEIATRNAADRGSRARFLQGDAELLPFPDGSFDLAISCECLEHVPHPRAMAREITRVLRPGASFCLTTENYLNGMLVAWLHCWISGRPFNSGAGVQPRENFFFFWMVRGYLQEAGLVVERMESSHYQWLLLPRVDPARLRTDSFEGEWASRIAFPFGRHFSFFGRKGSSRAGRS